MAVSAPVAPAKAAEAAWWAAAAMVTTVETAVPQAGSAMAAMAVTRSRPVRQEALAGSPVSWSEAGAMAAPAVQASSAGQVDAAATAVSCWAAAATAAAAVPRQRRAVGETVETAAIPAVWQSAAAPAPAAEAETAPAAPEVTAGPAETFSSLRPAAAVPVVTVEMDSPAGATVETAALAGHCSAAAGRAATVGRPPTTASVAPGVTAATPADCRYGAMVATAATAGPDGLGPTEPTARCPAKTDHGAGRVETAATAGTAAREADCSARGVTRAPAVRAATAGAVDLAPPDATAPHQGPAEATAVTAPTEAQAASEAPKDPQEPGRFCSCSHATVKPVAPVPRATAEKAVPEAVAAGAQ